LTPLFSAGQFSRTGGIACQNIGCGLSGAMSGPHSNGHPARQRALPHGKMHARAINATLPGVAGVNHCGGTA